MEHNPDTERDERPVSGTAACCRICRLNAETEHSRQTISNDETQSQRGTVDETTRSAGDEAQHRRASTGDAERDSEVQVTSDDAIELKSGRWFSHAR